MSLFNKLKNLFYEEEVIEAEPVASKVAGLRQKML